MGDRRGQYPRELRERAVRLVRARPRTTPGARGGRGVRAWYRKASPGTQGGSASRVTHGPDHLGTRGPNVTGV
jgi:hypothetical protein